MKRLKENAARFLNFTLNFNEITILRKEKEQINSLLKLMIDNEKYEENQTELLKIEESKMDKMSIEMLCVYVKMNLNLRELKLERIQKPNLTPLFLSLSGTSLQSFSLKVIELNYDEVKNLIVFLDECRSLKDFSLWIQIIQREKSEELAAQLKKCTQLEKLELVGLAPTKKIILFLGEKLAGNDSLRSFTLKKFNGEERDFETLFLGLEKNTGLEEIYLEDLSSNNFSTLIDALKHKANLNHIYLSNISTPRSDFSLVKESPELRSIDIGQYVLRSENEADFFQGIKKHPNLQKVKIGNSSFSETSFSSLVQVLKENEKITSIQFAGSIKISPIKIFEDHRFALTYINFSFITFGEEGCQDIAFALARNDPIETLLLVCCEIKAKGAEYIADALRFNSQLHYLSLRNNTLSDEGGVALGRTLKQNRALNFLCLEGCHIGPEGGKAISEGLAVNNSLSKLNLENNNLQDEGTIFLSSFLPSNHSLVYLNLSDNLIGLPGVQAIQAQISHNTTLCNLLLRYNFFEEQEEALREKFYLIHPYLRVSFTSLQLLVKNNIVYSNLFEYALFIIKLARSVFFVM